MSATQLAALWRAAWQGPAGGFDKCCTPDVGYEDPVAQVPLHGVDALEAHAASLRDAAHVLRFAAVVVHLAPYEVGVVVVHRH